MFPGKPDGTISEKIAHFITTGIIEQSDYLLDLHAGDGHEALWPHVYQNFIGEPVVDRGTELLARASGFAHIVLYRDRPRDPARSISCQNTAITHGKPALTIESGGPGGRDDESVERILGAIDNIMRYLKMIAGEPCKPETLVIHPRVHYVPSPATGILYPLVKPGQTVAPGMRVAYVTDFFGIGVGLGLSMLAGRAMRSLLFSVTPWDPQVYFSVPVLAIVMAVAASLLPARRAARVDPLTALRHE